jgi:hypothetical protein
VDQKEKGPSRSLFFDQSLPVPVDGVECVLTVSAQPSVMSAHTIALTLCQKNRSLQSQVMSNIVLSSICNTSSPDADISSKTATGKRIHALLYHAWTR